MDARQQPDLIYQQQAPQLAYGHGPCLNKGPELRVHAWEVSLDLIEWTPACWHTGYVRCLDHEVQPMRES
jgi:hypothetical protein